MYKVEKQSYGFYVTLFGNLTAEEVVQWEAEVVRLWPPENGPRSTVLDVRALILPEAEVQTFMTSMFTRMRQQGLVRLAVIVASPIIKARAVQMAYQSEGTDIIRFFDVSKTPDWQAECLEWISQGANPVSVPGNRK